jgi:hypothetical protein
VAQVKYIQVVDQWTLPRRPGLTVVRPERKSEALVPSISHGGDVATLQLHRDCTLYTVQRLTPTSSIRGRAQSWSLVFCQLQPPCKLLRTVCLVWHGVITKFHSQASNIPPLYQQRPVTARPLAAAHVLRMYYKLPPSQPLGSCSPSMTISPKYIYISPVSSRIPLCPS